ncbi:MAG: DUF2877 domain-containing protein [Anaerolinea sp.]|nr:DUF2877 domain-containing protein [Anaerolinea sp.]
MHIESISSRVSPILRSPGLAVRVESAFAEAVNLVTPHGAAFSLVSRRVGNGPLNAVVSHPQALALAGLHPGARLRGDGQWLTQGDGWRLALTPATPWNPVPDYARLTHGPQAVRRNLAWLPGYLAHHAPAASLAAPASSSHPPATRLMQAQAGQVIDGLLQSYRQGDLGQVAAQAGRLAGLGPGLTPAGDDWLAGWLVGLRAAAALDSTAPPLPLEVVGQAVVASARTTRLSLAFLQAAADGAAAEPWHMLLAGLPSDDPDPLRPAAAAILRTGATSGADMLAGFLAAFRGLRNSQELETRFP